jgi:hypothetical protein
MPFGLRNAGITFQRLMDSLLGNMPFAFVYLDDILLASPSAAEHRRHLSTVFSLLQDNGLVINADKCTFGLASMEFLGHHIGPLASSLCLPACRPSPSSLAPTTVRQLQAFLGLFNFYTRFIPAGACLILLLTLALHSNPGGNLLLQVQ